MDRKFLSTLLTPQEVASLLKISVRTVYENAKRLGGFYPAGIKVLRFHPDAIEQVIQKGMVGPRTPFPADTDMNRRGRRYRGEEPLRTSDPEDPYGVLALSRRLAEQDRKKKT